MKTEKLIREKEEITNLVTELEFENETAFNKIRNLQADTQIHPSEVPSKSSSHVPSKSPREVPSQLPSQVPSESPSQIIKQIT